MSWMIKALKTYEVNSALAGVIHEGEVPLVPIAHQLLKVQLEIGINRKGELVNAQEVANKKTIIPVTESSGGRSSGIAPHALNDTLGYIAGDLKQYMDAANEKKYEAYIEQLEKWKNSAYSSAKVEAVYKYVQKKHVAADLVACGILKLDDDGRLIKGGKIGGMDYEKVMVRFRVVASGDDIDATWEDTGLMELYARYYCSTQTGTKDICYLTGREEMISTNHPKGVLASDFGAKLISANDNTNFTFRGRFADASEACVLSYEASQKAHAALAWLSQMQGVSVGNKDKRTYICWSFAGKTAGLFRGNCLGSEGNGSAPKTLPEYKDKLWKAFSGYTDALIKAGERDSEVMIMGLDAATTGRLAVTYYSELLMSDFLDSMRHWQEKYRWYFWENGEKVIKSVSALQIVKCAYGTQRNNLDETERKTFLEVDDRVLKQQMERLLPCLLQEAPIPWDMVNSLVRSASELQRYSYGNREYILAVACGVVAGIKRKDLKGEDDMGLDQTCTDRSYLFGRLLAVCERVEEVALYKKGEVRGTNALRFRSAFTKRPAATYLVLSDLLNPYYEMLAKDGKHSYYQKIETEIVNMISEMDNRPLNENYLLGYASQRMELYKPKPKAENEQNESEE